MLTPVRLGSRQHTDRDCLCHEFFIDELLAWAQGERPHSSFQWIVGETKQLLTSKLGLRQAGLELLVLWQLHHVGRIVRQFANLEKILLLLPQAGRLGWKTQTEWCWQSFAVLGRGSRFGAWPNIGWTLQLCGLGVSLVDCFDTQEFRKFITPPRQPKTETPTHNQPCCLIQTPFQSIAHHCTHDVSPSSNSLVGSKSVSPCSPECGEHPVAIGHWKVKQRWSKREI